MEFGGHAWPVAEVQLAAPFAAQPVDLGCGEGQPQSVVIATLEVVLEPETCAEVVRSPGLAHGCQHQSPLIESPGHFRKQLQSIETIGGGLDLVHLQASGFQSGLCDQSAGFHTPGAGSTGLTGLAVRPRRRSDGYFGDLERSLATTTLRVPPCDPFGRRHGKPRQLHCAIFRRAHAGSDHALQAREVGGGGIAELGREQYILAAQARDLRFCVASRQQIGELIGHGEHGVQSLRGIHGRTYVDGDDHIGAERQRHIDRQIVGHAAVDQQPSSHLLRRHKRGDGHAREQGLRQIAVPQQHWRTGRDVGGDRDKRNR